jgi:isopropylmalate/homocitrate/citramalate synthase
MSLLRRRHAYVRVRAHKNLRHDTSDGEQSPGCSMNLGEKVRLARRLQKLGVDVIEAGFPIASDGDFAAVRAVALECREATVAALCRTTEQDIVRAWEAVGSAARPRLHTFVATSDIHLEHKLKKTRAEVLRMTREAVRLARTLHRRRGVLGRGRDAQRPRLPLRSLRRGGRRGRAQCSTSPTRSATRRPRSFAR